MTSQYHNPRLDSQSQPYANPSAGPSTAQYRRQSSRDISLTSGDQPPASSAFVSGTSAGHGQSRDTSSYEERGPISNFRASMTGADPQTAPSIHRSQSQSFYPGHQHRSPPLPPPPDSQIARPQLLPIPHSSRSSISLSPNPEPGSPPRERLPSSTSVSSMSSAQRGRRAPAPAALDLSPRSQRVLRDAAALGDRYGSLGLGSAPGTSEGTRAVTESYIDTSAYQRASRPLPALPAPHRSTSIGTAPTLPPSPSYPPGANPPYRNPAGYQAYPQRPPIPSTTAPHLSASPSMPLMAQAGGHSGNRVSAATGSGHHLGITAMEDSRVSKQTSPVLPNITAFSPTTPDMLDPSNIDRRTLIGVGELSTPRWATSTEYQHLRTPQPLPGLGVSASMPQTVDRPPTTSAPALNWAKGESGLGLGVGVLEGVREESPQTGRRPRHHTMSHQESPSKSRSKAQAPDRFAEHSTLLGNPRQAEELAALLTLGSLKDFDFDTSMAAALATSLSLPDEMPSPPKRASEHRASAPPLQSAYARPLPEQELSRQPLEDQRQNVWSAPSSTVPQPASPGSARSRIYARRQERQASALASQASQEVPLVPQRSTSKLSPPNSADSQSFSQRSPRDARKTPPSKDRDVAVRQRNSPSTSHHEILKHFAPKDFSHLPPSPSSASINQFLRGSGSVNNFASVSTPPGTVVAATPAYPSSTSVSSGPSKSSLHRSESGAMRSLQSAQKVGWEGMDVGPDTAEALRKLDGLGGTPGKQRAPGKTKTSTSAASLSSRPGTPPVSKGRASLPSTERKSSNKAASPGSLKGSTQPNLNANGDSPLNAWIDIGEDLPVPMPGPSRRLEPRGSSGPADLANLSVAKRESSSSTSFIGTPTSRDSQSLPTTSTTPSSNSGFPRPELKGGRRASGGSDVSNYSDALQQLDTSSEKVGEPSVPPVPPLPKGYMSMRHGLSNAAGSAGPPSYIPLQDPSPILTPPGEVGSPSASSLSALSDSAQAVRPRPMNKKWSFSSALSMKLHGKESSASPITSPSSPLDQDEQDDSAAPWTEIQRAEVPSPQQRRIGSNDSVPNRYDNRSNHSTTPIATSLAPPKVSGSGKRHTPSSIPFFRRTSSSSIQKEPQETPKTSATKSSSQATSSGSQSRKSMLGMHIPSMLRGSSSKRGLSQQLQPPPPQTVETKAEPVTTGWSGRKRGKTLSISGQPQLQPQPAVDMMVKPKTSVESSLNHRSSAQSNHSGSTVNGSSAMRTTKSGLPPIVGSPRLRQPTSTTSLRNSESPREPPSSTPTKIPRIASRPSEPTPAAHGSMPPPALPRNMASSRSTSGIGASASATMKDTSSMADLSRPIMNEFGMLSIHGSTPRHTSVGAHRAHLLAPMSARGEKRVEKMREPVIRTRESGQMIPPSRRNLPIPPSTAAAPTASSIAKRSSREFRPSVSRRSSKDTASGRDETPSGSTSPIKPSKSLHAKLSIPSGSRMPTSSSMGAPGSSHRRTSLTTESPSVSPADDEEMQGDAEMQAYVNRRRTRRASSGAKKDDLADITAFPEDTSPAEPTSQRAFISTKLSSMSDFERREVLDFDLIYYTPPHRIHRPAQPGGMVYNNGYDDERGDYLVVEGDHLCYRYEVIGILGKGSFGQVVQCRDHLTGGSAAVKIIRNKKRFHAQALVEVKILQQLVEWDPEDKHFMVRMTEHFYFRSHLCIVTELLSINLYELIKANSFAGFSTILIRRFTSQMLASLQLMRSHRIVHCDLKPENILLCHPIKSGIKVIDFGSSCHETEKVYTYIQSRFYRSPEVILGMNYAMAIDMWSLGCILAELFTGVPIFPGENEHEQLACIMEVLGAPDRYIVEKASRRKLFFDATGTPRPFVNAKGKRRRPGTKSLSAILKCDDDLFVDFIAKCLTWDPDKRLKPTSALRHPWILTTRRRAPSTLNRDERSSSRLGSPGQNQSMRTSGRTISDLAAAATGGGKEKNKQLLISPPTPLIARQTPASAPRLAQSVSSSRTVSNS